MHVGAGKVLRGLECILHMQEPQGHPWHHIVMLLLPPISTPSTSACDPSTDHATLGSNVARGNMIPAKSSTLPVMPDPASTLRGAGRGRTNKGREGERWWPPSPPVKAGPRRWLQRPKFDPQYLVSLVCPQSTELGVVQGSTPK